MADSAYIEGFLLAVREGDDIRVEALLLEDPGLAACRDESGRSALLTALFYQQRFIASLLLEQGLVLDVWEAAAVGDLARVQQCIEGDSMLLAERSNEGYTALHFAAWFGRPEVVGWLLASGAAVNAIAGNPTEVQPLHAAVAGGHREVVELLLEGGAEINAQQAEGFTPLDLALDRKDRALEALLQSRGALANRWRETGLEKRGLRPEV